MDKINHSEDSQKSKTPQLWISVIDFYTVVFLVLHLYFLEVMLQLLNIYLNRYLNMKLISTHILAFLNGFSLFMLLYNLYYLGKIVRSTSQESKQKYMADITTNMLIILVVYILIQILSARVTF